MEQTTAVATQNGVATTQMTAKKLFDQDQVKQKFQELLGKRSTAFITSVLQIVASNDLLAKAEPSSVYHAAAVAATLDLPLNNALGFAYIIPFNKWEKDGTQRTLAQFQIGYKGLIQLAQRSGQFKTISAAPIYEGQLVESDPLMGFRFDFTKKESDTVIGYAAYFSLLNGFEKTLYMTIDDLNKHGLRFSQTFKKGYGLWKDDFHSMAIKTTLKLLLAKYAPLSVEMQRAVISDQAVINNVDTQEVTYVDSTEVRPDATLIAENKERKRVMEHIAGAKNFKQLGEVAEAVGQDDELKELYNKRFEEIENMEAAA